jgi:predicted SnoaL-like aldol condensation-catalyzing enzyme
MINRSLSYIILIILTVIVSCKPSTNSDKKSESNTHSEKKVTDTNISSTCEKDLDFVSEKGHDYRDRSTGTLQQMFKAAKQKDFDGFMATAADPYIQHSPDLPDGMKPVWDLLVNRPAGFSNKQIQWIGENGFLDNGNFLVMLREVDRGDSTGLSKIVDIMRFDDNGKYAEHWDIRQPLSAKTASGRSETGTSGKFAENPVTYSVEEEEKNKKIAVIFLNLAFNKGELDKALDAMVYEGYIQHNPFIADGIEPVKQIFDSGKIPALCYDIKYVVAQNDIVVIYSRVTSDAGVSAVVDILRIRDGKLVEHWDVVEPVPADNEMPHKNGMF